MYNLKVYESNGNLYLKSPSGYIRVEMEINGDDVILKPTNDRVEELNSPIEKDISSLNKKKPEIEKEETEDFVKETKFNYKKHTK